MARYRSTPRKSEEEKRNIKVDPSRIPEWESEIESIRYHFQQYNFNQIASAADYIQKMRDNLYFDSSYDRDKDRVKLKEWKTELSVDKLIRLSKDNSTPGWLGNGTGSYASNYQNTQRKSLIEVILEHLNNADEDLAKCKTSGTTNSFWVSVFTSKVTVDNAQSMERLRADRFALSREIPKIEAELRLLAEVHSQSLKYATRMSQIEERLSLAKEKKEALERFDAKHGRAFAKAAAADNQTRNRAVSLKRIVKKTKECPYCGGILGTNPHLDHIYPVSKGGLSIVENLVWCCLICNGLKSDKGLMQFIKERGVPIEQVLSRLHAIGKHV